MISIIVPVYNVEPYLDRCVASLVAQTYRDIELILVDDGSPDDTVAHGTTFSVTLFKGSSHRKRKTRHRR